MEQPTNSPVAERALKRARRTLRRYGIWIEELSRPDEGVVGYVYEKWGFAWDGYFLYSGGFPTQAEAALDALCSILRDDELQAFWDARQEKRRKQEERFLRAGKDHQIFPSSRKLV